MCCGVSVIASPFEYLFEYAFLCFLYLECVSVPLCVCNLVNAFPLLACGFSRVIYDTGFSHFDRIP